MIDSFDLNIRHLYAAVAISRIGSISRAAEEIHTTQPALTSAIRNLEAKLNHKIFERRNNGVEPTPEGRIFLAHVQDGLNLLASATEQLRQGSKLKPINFPERQISSVQLRAFLAVLQTGGYTRAARDLGISQPSVHRAVRELQALLGVTLFSTIGTVMRSPDIVQQFANNVKLARTNIQSGITELTSLTQPGTGRIIVGSLPLARSVLLPKVLAHFSVFYPKLSIIVVEGQYDEMITSLRNGSIDMLIGALRHDFSFVDLQQRILFDDKLYIVAHAGHPLASGNPTLPQLASYPWIVSMANSPARNIWERQFQDAAIPLPSQIIECGSVLLARGLMLEGEWLGMMSLHQLKFDEEIGVLTRIGRAVPGSIRPIGLTTRANWRQTSAQSVFLQTLVDISESLSGDDWA